MAKKFVRGITDIRTINNQDFDTNNVNDLLADGNNNYIHRRKADKSEEYHCLTDNIKTIKSTNNYLTVTNDNASNTATLTVNHDDTKQDKLTAGDGIVISNNKVSIKQSNAFKGDLNTLKETQFIKTTNGVTNLPPNVTIYDGILEVYRVGDVLKQTYTPFHSGSIYIRTANGLDKPTETWREWYKISTTPITVTAAIEPGEENTDAISTIPELGEE